MTGPNRRRASRNFLDGHRRRSVQQVAQGRERHPRDFRIRQHVVDHGGWQEEVGDLPPSNRIGYGSRLCVLDDERRAGAHEHRQAHQAGRMRHGCSDEITRRGGRRHRREVIRDVGLESPVTLHDALGAAGRTSGRHDRREIFPSSGGQVDPVFGPCVPAVDRGHVRKRSVDPNDDFESRQPSPQRRDRRFELRVQEQCFALEPLEQLNDVFE